MDKKEEAPKPRTRKDYLWEFNEANDISTIYHNHKEIKKTAEELVKVLKKEDLTYTEAYASLQYAYNKLKFESNFVKLPKN